MPYLRSATLDVFLAALMAMGALAETAEPQILANERRVRSPDTAQIPFELKEVPKGRQVRLSLNARVDWPGLAGFNPWMVVAVNGQGLAGADLINKPLEFTTRNGVEFAWQKNANWTVLYSPDFSDAVRTQPLPWGFPDTDPYHFVWDITRYVKTGANTLSVTHVPLLAQGSTLVLADIRVEAGEPIPSLNLSGTVAPAPDGPVPTWVARGPARIDLDVRLRTGGAMRLKIDRRSFYITTRTSAPQGQWIESRDGPWQAITRGQRGEAQWQGPGYQVKRTVELRDDHVQIADTLTNTSDALVGVIYENRLDISWLSRPSILLGGRPPCAPEGSEAPSHPSVIAQAKDLAIGLFAEDDIFRMHHRAFMDGQTIGLADPRLGIAPGQSHTLEWSVYPAPQGDYWDIINAVRRNWGSNIPIPGAGIFDHPNDGNQPPEYYQTKIRSRGLKLAFTGQTDFQGDEIQKYGGGVVDLAEGTAIPMAKRWCANAAEWVKKMRAADPSVKTLVYMHPTNCTEPNAEKLYTDCKLIDGSGTHVTSPYRYPVYEYLPTLDKAYGKAYLQTFETIMKEINPGGIFMDEISEGSIPRYVYRAPWDGCTVTIDQMTHAVAGRCSSTVLLMQPWKTTIVQRLREHDRLFVGNGPAYTRTMLGWKMPLFHETGSYSFLVDMHLCTPWGLGTHDNENDDRTRSRMVRRALDYAGVICVYSWGDQPKGFHYMQVMFPITPEELHPGMILGKERIVTNRSGQYGWPDGAAADTYVFDGAGQLVKNPPVKEIRDGPQRLIEVRMPGDHFAIFVRQAKGH